jgi:hypothetical protein
MKLKKIALLETNAGLASCVNSCKIPPNSETVLPVHVSRRTEGEQVLLEPTPSLVKKESNSCKMYSICEAR